LWQDLKISQLIGIFTAEELIKRIKSLEKDTKILQRLYFIKYRYEGYQLKMLLKG